MQMPEETLQVREGWDVEYTNVQNEGRKKC